MVIHNNNNKINYKNINIKYKNHKNIKDLLEWMMMILRENRNKIN